MRSSYLLFSMGAGTFQKVIRPWLKSSAAGAEGGWVCGEVP